MTITVGIPVFNRVNTISDCIDSVLAQKTEIGFNILVVDNCSDDGTKDLLLKYAENEKVSVIYNDENIGLADNWTKVFNCASGDYIYLLHSDDLMLHGALQLVASFLKSYPLIDFAFGNVDIYKNNKIQKNVFRKRKASGYLENRWLLEKFYYRGSHPAPPQTWIIKNGIVEKMGGFIKNNICCDFNMSFKIVASNYKVGYIRKSLALWVLHDNNIGGGEIEKHKKDLMNAIKDLEKKSKVLGLDSIKLSKIKQHLYKREVFEFLKKGEGKKAAEMKIPRNIHPFSNRIDFFIFLFFYFKLNLIKPLYRLKLSFKRE